jgi:xylulokinase
MARARPALSAGGALHLGLDVGTQGAKALLLDEESGRVVARAGAGYGLLEGLPPGAAEQHPAKWLAAVRDATARVLDEAALAGGSRAGGSSLPAGAGRAGGSSAAAIAARVAGIGVSGQQHGLVVLDERGAVLRAAKLWCDTSTAAEAGELSAALGRPVPAGFTASKLLWLARHEPATWTAVRRVLLPHDFINVALTGRATMEAGDASGTGWFDPVARTWDPVALAALDALTSESAPGGPLLAELLPPLLAPGEPAGTLSPEGAALLGLRAGIPVAAGGGDNMCAAVGSGATAPGAMVVSLGTSATLFAYSAQPVVDPAGLIAPFCDSTGGWLPLLCLMNCTGVAEEVVALTGRSHAELTALAACEPAGCDGALLIPYLQGERVPDLPHARASLHGLRPGMARPGLLYRAALEGVALNLAWGAGRLAALGLPARRVAVVGDGARNPLWRQILADALGAPVTPLAEPEAAALGAALLARWTCSRLEGAEVSPDALARAAVRTGGPPSEPDPARAEVYAGALSRFRALVERLHGA